MANYKETTVTGNSYTRCNQIVVGNRLGGVPQIRFDKQIVVALELGGTTVNGVGSIEIPFDAARIIPLIDPETGDDTGASITYGEICNILHSAFIDADTVPAPFPTGE